MHKEESLLTVAKRQPISNGVIKIIVSGLGCGYVPIFPGTSGTLLGFIIFWGVKNNLYIYGLVLILIVLLGFIFISQAEKIFRRKDDTKIVLDEIFGILFCFWGIGFVDVPLAVVGFLLFRLLDILKPPPARSCEKLHGAAGVMLDDLAAAGYTNLILRLMLKFR
ncbi:MAG: phosphatidylglycerophosphatase A [Candidatus Ratteibacteria bacterium]|nr:phosphatidylglycerophosphatase A [Candidatus Ratteibacteria bacterium]